MSDIVIFELVEEVTGPFDPTAPETLEVAPARDVLVIDEVDEGTVEVVELVEDVVVVDVVPPETVEFSIVEDVTVVETMGSGPPGPPGPAGGIYHHSQIAPATTWHIEHNLGFRPSVNVQDSAGTYVYGDVVYLDDNTVEVSFAYAFGGRADLS